MVPILLRKIRLAVGLTAATAAALVLILSPGIAQARCSQRVYVYSADWCGTCRQLRAYLDRNRIRYTLLDATTPRVQADMIARFGNTAIPRTLIGRSVVSGFDPARINQLCR
ncbi:glutaredoxin family protein [Methyloceanibacter sp.]|uniref:glutaredoxin family protein n=1 Tax=Methyloceanibacter sp. TaxID=1965321 RepID=UPI002083F05B|nr:glutaredoxin family protein [Methyloceanibacter sp.]GFO82455.1 MAG: hypothetical protein A49_20820 [Methyloceanibacter sp.]HML92141.1 glutaredoxin family protein [Methyloceanibacter sp.]